MLLSDTDAPFQSQSWWVQQWHTAQTVKLSQSFQGPDKVRFECQSRPHAGAWLGVLPCRNRSHLLPTVEFRCLVRRFLGMPIHPGEQGARCPKCSTILDEGGHHLVCCHHNQLTRRHHVMVEALAGVARLAGVPYKKEQRVDDNSRPGDLLLNRLSVNGPRPVGPQSPRRSGWGGYLAFAAGAGEK